MSSPLLQRNEMLTESNSGLEAVAPPTLSPLRPSDARTSDLDTYAPAETRDEEEERLDSTIEDKITKLSAHSVPHLNGDAEQQNGHSEPSSASVFELSDQLRAASVEDTAPAAAASGESSAEASQLEAPPLKKAGSISRKFAEADFDSLHEDAESAAIDTTSEASASSSAAADKPTLRLTGHTIEFFDGRPPEVSFLLVLSCLVH
jgi:hypothetical protein